MQYREIEPGRLFGSQEMFVKTADYRSLFRFLSKAAAKLAFGHNF